MVKKNFPCTETLTYIGSIISQDGGAGADNHNWRSAQYNTMDTTRIIPPNLRAVNIAVRAESDGTRPI